MLSFCVLEGIRQGVGVLDIPVNHTPGFIDESRLIEQHVTDRHVALGLGLSCPRYLLCCCRKEHPFLSLITLEADFG